jgi:chaperonin GroEL (HSP60 family)
MFQANKPKSAAKLMISRSEKLQNEVLTTLKHTAEMVGVTLGPGGQQVLIERPEIGMRPIMTKDGVTVIKNLGYDEASKQLILEAVRDAAVKTANEAGDGTTTATILSNAIAQATFAYVKSNPKTSSQRIVREMQKLVPYLINKINDYKIQPEGEDAEKILLQVATLSANGDTELAQSIVDGLNTVGDEGDMTIIEATGPSEYKIERIHGYTVERGYEESARHLANGFINDASGTMIVLEKPIVLLYDGVINDISQVWNGLTKISMYMEENKIERPAVIVAHGFSDMFLGDMHANWNHPNTKLKIYPMLTPDKAIQNWKTNFLYDMQAYVGTSVFNPLDRPLVDVDVETLLNNNRATELKFRVIKLWFLPMKIKN